MARPIPPDVDWRVRICRPAFQDFQRIFRRYYARSILNRQLLKLRWWDPEERLVIDLPWNSIPDTNLKELLVEVEGELTTSVRVLFFEYSSHPEEPTLWVLGGMRMDEEFGELQRAVYFGRSLIAQERVV